jgi:PRTRC genetic system protein F
MLEIPHLSAAPRSYKTIAGNPLIARTALALLDAGHIRPDAAGTPAQLLRQGLQQWLAPLTAGMRCVEIHLHYVEADAKDRRDAEIALRTDLLRPLIVGGDLGTLQKAVPGLGETVLWHLDHDMPGLLEIYTPASALSTACWMEWGGADDESFRVQECIDEGEDPANVEILTRAEFDKAIPPWASRPRERIKPAGLKRIAKGRGKAARVAAAVLALHAVRGNYESDDEGRRLWPPAQALRWSKHDLVSMRLLDDLGEQVFQSGEELQSFLEFRFADTDADMAGLQPFLRTAEKSLRALQAADHLMQLIAENIRAS